MSRRIDQTAVGAPRWFIMPRKAGLHLHVEPDELIEQLEIYADEAQLQKMIEDMTQMTDLREFVRSHTIELPGFNL